MRKFAILFGLALGLALCGCGTSSVSPQINTTTNGNWEAQLSGGKEQASLLSFVTAFTVTDSGPLATTGFSFINSQKCFALTNGVNQQTVNGNVTLNTATSGQVTGTLNMTVASVTPPGNTLTLTGNLTGTTTVTAGVTGTLSNGVVVGAWSLKGGKGDPSCADQGTFLMCEGAATCTPP